jgi:hypothetical protein
MRRKNYIPVLSGKSGAIEVSHAIIENGRIRPLKNDCGKVELRDLHPSEKGPIRQWSGLCG